MYIKSKVFLFTLLIFNYFIYLSGCALSLLLYRVFPSAVNRGYSLVAVHGLLIVEASLIKEHRL